MPDDSPRCSGKTKTGKACVYRAKHPDGRCDAHSDAPAAVRYRAKRAARGGSKGRRGKSAPVIALVPPSEQESPAPDAWGDLENLPDIASAKTRNQLRAAALLRLLRGELDPKFANALERLLTGARDEPEGSTDADRVVVSEYDSIDEAHAAFLREQAGEDVDEVEEVEATA